ncbi:MAG: tetratricopeptide repeat protein [Acidimicrobiia bacterium]|nr:tetratricopeptide repeat protein [Acidimicrobiia bacterium]
MKTGHSHVTAVGPVSVLFFASGLSGLIYQVAWVREFGNVFGNTVYSASLVVAVFMLGLGAGSHVIGRWADGRYATQPDSLLRAYGWAELIIAALGAWVVLLLPSLGWMSAATSWYSPDAIGWQRVSSVSYAIRGITAVVLLVPVTFVMGGTLTLLIRHLVRDDLATTGPRTALLYGVNTLGAAVGCFSTDFLLVPAMGLRATQGVAVALNLAAGVGALALARHAHSSLTTGATGKRRRRGATSVDPEGASQNERSLVVFTSIALALTGFAAMGLEILWLRHISLQLGQFRAVFSTVLTVALVGMGAGSLLTGVMRRHIVQPAQWLMVVQGGLVASSLLGIASADAIRVHEAGRQPHMAIDQASFWPHNLTELWFNAKPVIAEIALPALLMGLTFPIANALVQRAERSVAGRTGLLYLSNTLGAVTGSLGTGFLLLPLAGTQTTAVALAGVALAAIGPLFLVSRAAALEDDGARRPAAPLAGALVIGALAVIVFLRLPAGFVLQRAQALPTLPITLSEGVNEVIAVTDSAPEGRALWTNGHPMAGTEPLGQRYMRALAHIPLLAMDKPKRVLVIGFGVGNTAHAATLHPSVDHVHIAELSAHVLAHASYFRDANGDVLNDPRVSVYVNDGRQHLQVQPAVTYDLITLEPPPIAHAGVGALYSREFYELARTRLRPGGYISQWLPVYQVSESVTLAMIRAFVDVFPQAVLLSGAKADLILLGTTAPALVVDPERLEAALERAPNARGDLRRLDLGSVREIVGTFIGSAQILQDTTRQVMPVTDDRPLQEYTVRSLLNAGGASTTVTTSASLIDLRQVSAWCPRCFVDGKPVPLVSGLDTYLTLLDQFYMVQPGGSTQVRSDANRSIDGSKYLGAILPYSAEVHTILGISLLNRGETEHAVGELRKALRIGPNSANARWHLGRALSATSDPESIEHLQRAVEMTPDNAAARYDLATALLESGRDDEALEHFRRALPALPNAAQAYNALGVALASRHKLVQAVEQFREALRLEPAFAGARANLERVLASQADGRGGR